MVQNGYQGPTFSLYSRQETKRKVEGTVDIKSCLSHYLFRKFPGSSNQQFLTSFVGFLSCKGNWEMICG